MTSAISHDNTFRTAHHALLDWARRTPDRLFLSQPVDGELRDRSWKQAADEARRMASALSGIGLQPGDKVAILAKNSAEWVLADLAIAMAGMISVPVYPTAGADTIAYVLGHSEASAVFVGKLDDPAVAIEAIPGSLPSIAFPYEIEGCDYRWDSLVGRYPPLEVVSDPLPEDVMTILYTSGSTGTPKGVVLSFGAYCYASRETAVAMELTPDDRLFSYLPLAHITERTCCAGPAIYIGTSMGYTESLETFTSDLKQARPTAFLSVPRLWVKFQSGVHAKIPPARLKFLLALPVIGKVVAKKIREELGFGSCDRFGSGAAPISPSTLEWFHRIGIEISEGWGMSETSGLATANSPFDRERIGTIGVPLNGTEVRLSDEGEILLRSPGLFSGYYKNKELSREVFTDDGFFRTGDKAEWIESTSAYRITGRVKDIFKSAKGKYVMPVPIESRLSANPLLEQLCVMGSGLRAPVVVIVLSEAARHLPESDVESRIQATLEEVNGNLESHERLAHAFIANEEWTAGNGLLTPTLKLKRNVLEEKYRELISGTHDTQVVWERP
ncbi:MAG: AMP-binding protein [Woeseiaceae bacterium]|nr:AMP-binding protein [Woeseiaceae bacterium]